MLRDRINDSLLKESFPESMQLGNTTPVHKKDEPTDKEDYRPLFCPYYQKFWKDFFMINLRNIWSNS